MARVRRLRRLAGVSVGSRADGSDHRRLHGHRPRHRAASGRGRLDGARGCEKGRAMASGLTAAGGEAGAAAAAGRDRPRADRTGRGACERGLRRPSRAVRRARQQRRHRRRRAAGADLARTICAVQFEVNLFGQVAVTRALLAALRAARGADRARLLHRRAGHRAISMGPTHASKHAIEALGDALRRELHSSDIQVSLIEPGSVKTPIWEKTSGHADDLAIPRELQRAVRSRSGGVRPRCSATPRAAAFRPSRWPRRSSGRSPPGRSARPLPPRARRARRWSSPASRLLPGLRVRSGRVRGA